jgi:hypothetical protein
MRVNWMPYNICVERMSKKRPLKSKQLIGTAYAMRSAGGVTGRQQAAFKEWCAENDIKSDSNLLKLEDKCNIKA